MPEPTATPRHDALVCWADDNITAIANHVLLGDVRGDAIKIDLGGSCIYNDDGRRASLNGAQLAYIRSSPEVKALLDSRDLVRASVGRPTWEYPVIERVYQSERIVGYVDVFAVARYDAVRVNGRINRDGTVRLCRMRGEDGVRRLSIRVGLIVEAKTEIGSLGSTVRQIRKYETLLEGANSWDYTVPVVVSRDDAHRDRLLSQRIAFVNPDDEQWRTLKPADVRLAWESAKEGARSR